MRLALSRKAAVHSGSLANAQAGVAYTAQLTQTGALGAPNFMVTSGALPPGLSLSAAGTISGTLPLQELSISL